MSKQGFQLIFRIDAHLGQLELSARATAPGRPFMAGRIRLTALPCQNNLQSSPVFHLADPPIPAAVIRISFPSLFFQEFLKLPFAAF